MNNISDNIQNLDVSLLLQQLVAAIRPVIGLSLQQPSQEISTRIIDFAQARHRTAAILAHYSISGEHSENLTDDALSVVKALHRQNLMRELQQKTVHTRLTDIFTRRGIPFWALKGQGIADTLYPFAGARQSKDIDILIRPADADAALDIMQKGGFSAAKTRTTDISNLRHFRSGLAKDALFYDDQFAQHIEMHRRLLYVEPVGFSEMVRVETPAGEYITVDGVAGMFYTIMHGAMDYWSRLKWLVDLSLICRRIDSERLAALLDMAERFACKTALLASLYHCERVFGGSLPQETADEIVQMVRQNKGVKLLLARFIGMLDSQHDYGARSLWSRPDFPTPAWHIFPNIKMRAWLCGYVPMAYLARKYSH